MFGLFKKQISNEELAKILGVSILTLQKEIITSVVQVAQMQINDRIKDESLFLRFGFLRKIST